MKEWVREMWGRMVVGNMTWWALGVASVLFVVVLLRSNGEAVFCVLPGIWG